MEFVRRLQPLATIAEGDPRIPVSDSRIDRIRRWNRESKGKARAVATLIGEEDRPFASGSYVAVQRYVHDLERWRRLDDGEQETDHRKNEARKRRASQSEKTQTATSVV